MREFVHRWQGHLLPIQYERDLERLFSQFFKAEMPSPWPDFANLAELTPVAKHAAPGSHKMGLYALAASVLLLAAGQYYFSGVYSPRPYNRQGASEGHTEATNRAVRFHSKTKLSDDFSRDSDLGVLSGRR